MKNLPFNTTTDELRTVFAPFGTVARLVLPPSEITALVEFFEPSQAKKAFQKLAYSKVIICSIISVTVWTKSYDVTIQMKLLKHYFFLLLSFIMSF